MNHTSEPIVQEPCTKDDMTKLIRNETLYQSIRQKETLLDILCSMQDAEVGDQDLIDMAIERLEEEIEAAWTILEEEGTAS